MAHSSQAPEQKSKRRALRSSLDAQLRAYWRGIRQQAEPDDSFYQRLNALFVPQQLEKPSG